MSFYQNLIAEIAPDGPNPAGVEASMRLQYGTLDHLSRETFEKEIQMAADCEADEPGFLQETAKGFGLSDDFQKWEEERAHVAVSEGMTM